MNTNTEANVMVEILFRAEKAHVNLFLDLTLDVVFTDPGGVQKNLVNDPEYVSLHRELKDRLTEQIIRQDYPVPPRDLFWFGIH